MSELATVGLVCGVLTVVVLVGLAVVVTHLSRVLRDEVARTSALLHPPPDTDPPRTR